MSLLRALTNVDVPGTESQQPRYRLLLVLKRRASQVEEQLVLAGFQLQCLKDSDPEPDVIARQERDAAAAVLGQLPAKDAGPEASEKEPVQGDLGEEPVFDLVPLAGARW